MNLVSAQDQEILDALRSAVAEALDRKRRLGQYAVVWRDGRPIILGDELSSGPCRVPRPDIEGKRNTLVDLGAPIVGD
jgi:hypothetical protein